MNKKRIIIFLPVFLIVISCVFAETILLKSGKTIDGKIVEKTDKYIKIDFDGIPLTYYFEDIQSIDGQLLDNYTYLSSKHLKPSVEKNQDAITSYGLGIDSMVAGQPNNGIAYFKKALQIDPNFAMAHAAIGLAYVSLKKYAQAEPHLKKAVELDPDNPSMAEIYVCLGMNYFDAKGKDYLEFDEIAKSIPLFKKAIQLRPYSGAYARLGFTYMSLKKYDEATASFQKAIELDNTNAEAYDYLGTLYYLLQQKEKSRENLLRARALYEKQGNQYKAKEMSDNLSKLDENIKN